MREETRQLQNSLTVGLGDLQEDGKEHRAQIDYKKQHTPQDELALRGVFELREEHVGDEVSGEKLELSEIGENVGARVGEVGWARLVGGR